MARLGAQATRQSDAQARERADLWSAARRRRAAGRTPSWGGFPVGTRCSALCGRWGSTPFAALHAAVPAPTGRNGRRSALPCLLDDCAEWRCVVRCALRSGADRRSAFPCRLDDWAEWRCVVRCALRSGADRRSAFPCRLDDWAEWRCVVRCALRSVPTGGRRSLAGWTVGLSGGTWFAALRAAVPAPTGRTGRRSPGPRPPPGSAIRGFPAAITRRTG